MKMDFSTLLTVERTPLDLEMLVCCLFLFVFVYFSPHLSPPPIMGMLTMGTFRS